MLNALLLLALGLLAAATDVPPPECPAVKLECSDRISAKTCGQFQNAIKRAFQETFALRHRDIGIDTRGCDLFPGVKQILAKAAPSQLSLSAPLSPRVVAAFQLQTLSFRFLVDAWRADKTPTPISDYSMLATQFGAAIARAGVLDWMESPINLTLSTGDNSVVVGAADAADHTTLILAAKAGGRQALNSDDSFDEVFKKAIAFPATKKGSRSSLRARP